MKIAEILEEDLANFLDIGTKNTFNSQTNSGNGYVENINNDFKETIADLKEVYEKLIQSKDEQIALLNKMIEKYLKG